MEKFIKSGVIGHLIHHSKSPIIHNYWIQKHNLSGEYKAIDIAPINLGRDVQGLVYQGYSGFNVTIPHKQEIFKLCDEVDDFARIIGAVNTVMIKGQKLIGKNTDAFGFIENMKSFGFVIDKKRSVVVLGAGGAARAVVYGLLMDGFENIIVTNRTIEKAQDIATINKDKISALSWDRRHDMFKNTGLLVNTTALGMVGKDGLDMDISNITKDCIVYDIVYTPLMTPLLEQAKLQGNPIVTGIGMLLHQARPAFETWFGILPDIDDTLQQRVLE